MSAIRKLEITTPLPLGSTLLKSWMLMNFMRKLSKKKNCLKWLTSFKNSWKHQKKKCKSTGFQWAYMILTPGISSKPQSEATNANTVSVSTWKHFCPLWWQPETEVGNAQFATKMHGNSWLTLNNLISSTELEPTAQFQVKSPSWKMATSSWKSRKKAKRKTISQEKCRNPRKYQSKEKKTNKMTPKCTKPTPWNKRTKQKILKSTLTMTKWLKWMKKHLLKTKWKKKR